MKFLTYSSNSKKKQNISPVLIILLLTLSLSAPTAFSLKTQEESEYTLEASLDPEIEAEIENESKNIENLFANFNFMEFGAAEKSFAAPASKYIVDLSAPAADLSGWFAVSNPKFLDANLFPTQASNSKESVDFQNLEGENFIVNKSFPNAAEKDLTNKLLFFFRFKSGVLYFTSAKASMNVLGSLKPAAAEDSEMSNLKLSSASQTCFSVSDASEMTWTLCALNAEQKKKWLCSLQKYLNSPATEPFCTNENPNNNNNNNNNNKANEKKNNTKKSEADTKPQDKQKKHKNILIIPTESRKCNDKWNYLSRGSDWECSCAEGAAQSPIDLPDKAAARPSKIKPLFIYDGIQPISMQNSVDGLLVENEPVKIYHKNGALRIFHSYLGKVVAADGGVFHGEEIVFHTPSEHTINGKQFDLEVQVIHYGKSKGDIAKQVVLSFLFYVKPGVFNKFFEKLDYYNLPNEIDDFRDLKERLYIPEIFYNTQEADVNYMKDFSFFSYEGSLTFPPCTERTTYFVAATPMPISSTIIGLFREALRKPDFVGKDGKINKSNEQPKLNNRKVQPINGRKVVYYQSQLKGLNQ